MLLGSLKVVGLDLDSLPFCRCGNWDRTEHGFVFGQGGEGKVGKRWTSSVFMNRYLPVGSEMVVSMDLATYGGLCLALKRKGSGFERDVLWGGGNFPATQPPRALAFDAVLIAIRGRMLDKQAPGQSVFLARCVCFGFRMISCLSFLWNVSFSYTCAVSMALRCWAVLRLLNDQQG